MTGELALVQTLTEAKDQTDLAWRLSILAAVRAGHKVTSVAQAAGMTRQSVYNITGKADQ